MVCGIVITDEYQLQKSLLVVVDRRAICDLPIIYGGY